MSCHVKSEITKSRKAMTNGENSPKIVNKRIKELKNQEKPNLEETGWLTWEIMKKLRKPSLMST